MANLLYHRPVLLYESIKALNINPDGVYADFTFGGGSHSEEILKQLGKKGHLYAFDKDNDVVENTFNDSRFTFTRADYRFAYNFLRYYNSLPLDGIIADLGISSHHIDDYKRGFSFRFIDAELDMRMDINSSKTAAYILNNYAKEQLTEIFQNYGEIKYAGKIADTIINYRADKKIKKVSDLINIIEPYVPKNKKNQFYAKVFQALRIEVNDELASLKELLLQLPNLLKPSGRVVIISYHSLEDRLVKNYFKTGNFEGNLQKDFYGKIISPLIPVTTKPVIASEDEIRNNNKARSAKLRIAEKK